jgi:hypothetical protein
LEVVAGIQTTRAYELFWVINGVTNSSGVITGAGAFEIATEQFPVTIPGGALTISLMFDSTLGQPSIYSSRLIGPADATLLFGTDNSDDMAGHNVDDNGTTTTHADRLALNGDFAWVEWDLVVTNGPGAYTLETEIGIGTTRKTVLYWGENGVTNSFPEEVGSTGFEIVTKQYAVTIGVGTEKIQLLLDSTQGAPSIYGAALITATSTTTSSTTTSSSTTTTSTTTTSSTTATPQVFDETLLFGTDNSVDMAAHSVDDNGTVTASADRLALNGDFGLVEYELLAPEAGCYGLEVVAGIQTTRAYELFWVINGVTNSSGVITGAGGFEIAAEQFPVTIPSGALTVSLMFDSTLGQPSIYSSRLIGPADATLLFGTDNSDDMAAHAVNDNATVTASADRLALNGDFGLVNYKLVAPSAGVYTLEVVAGIQTTRAYELFYVIDSVTNSSGVITGAGGFEIATEQFSITIPAGALTIDLIFDSTLGQPSIYSSRLIGPADATLLFGTDNSDDMAAHAVNDNATTTTFADRLLLNGDFGLVEWILVPGSAPARGTYTLEAVMGLQTTRKAELFWVVNGVTNSSGEEAGPGSFTILTNSYIVEIPAGVSKIELIFDSTLGQPSIYRSTLTGFVPFSPTTAITFR